MKEKIIIDSMKGVIQNNVESVFNRLKTSVENEIEPAIKDTQKIKAVIQLKEEKLYHLLEIILKSDKDSSIWKVSLEFEGHKSEPFSTSHWNNPNIKKSAKTIGNMYKTEAIFEEFINEYNS